MGNVKIVVDHDKIDYSGPLDITELFKMIENFIFYMGFDKRQDKDFEQNTQNGKFLEWQISPWKWITDYTRYIIKVRILGYDLVKANVVNEGKKSKVDNGRIVVTIDAFVEYDLQGRWQDKPFLYFIGQMYDHFIFKVYTERFEHMLTHDVNRLHHEIEKFLNMRRSYKVISVPGV
ncbi:hypothetical protein HYS31_05020 [Candidatus Woesearchaeota archaeon]|nr:hypothetical protein [Candidatus Woesearchaeota archaeon]